MSNGNNALNWTEVHGGTPYLTSNVGTTGVRDPSIIRAHDYSKFWLLGTVSEHGKRHRVGRNMTCWVQDLKIYGNGNWNAAVRNGSRSIVIWESADLKDWGTPRYTQLLSGINQFFKHVLGFKQTSRGLSADSRQHVRIY